MGTKTPSFGSGKRESHDASDFYKRNLTSGGFVRAEAPQLCPTSVNSGLYASSSEDMKELPDNSVALMITSPPYHVGKEYDTSDTFDEYLDLLFRVFEETYRVLEPGGRAVVNAAGLGRSPYVHLPTFINAIMLEIGYMPRGEVIWVKAAGASGSCAWGSFMKASNPVLRDVHEHLLVFCKGWKDGKDRLQWGRYREGVSTIEKQDFLDWTLSVWNMAPESAKRVGHPAPFPVELPRRFIQLYSYEQDVILDPFIGAGTTAVAALAAGRKYVGYDTNPAYLTIAEHRLKEQGKALISEAHLQSFKDKTGA